jgi:hypothetical protein
MGVTDNWYTDGRVPSGIISLMDFIPVTDGIDPSVKLFNGVVNDLQLYTQMIDVENKRKT